MVDVLRAEHYDVPPGRRGPKRIETPEGAYLWLACGHIVFRVRGAQVQFPPRRAICDECNGIERHEVTGRRLA